MSNLSGIEVPRWVKKPGEAKRVETHAELETALADGWVLRLPPVADVIGASVVDGERPAELPDPEPEPEDEDPSIEPAKRKPGRPKGEASKKK